MRFSTKSSAAKASVIVMCKNNTLGRCFIVIFFYKNVVWASHVMQFYAFSCACGIVGTLIKPEEAIDVLFMTSVKSTVFIIQTLQLITHVGRAWPVMLSPLPTHLSCLIEPGPWEKHERDDKDGEFVLPCLCLQRFIDLLFVYSSHFIATV